MKVLADDVPPEQVLTDLRKGLEHLRLYGWCGNAFALDHDDLELDEDALGYPDAPIARASAEGALWLAVDAGRSPVRHSRFMAAFEALVAVLPGEPAPAELYSDALADWEEEADREQADVEALFAVAVSRLETAIARRAS